MNNHDFSNRVYVFPLLSSPTSRSEGKADVSGDPVSSNAPRRHRGLGRREGGSLSSCASGHDVGYPGRSNENPGPSNAGNYSSYISLVVSFPDEFSEDEDLNQAIIASMQPDM